MKYQTEISKEFSFEAAHRLPGVPEGHKCSRLHGHSFRVIITVTGPLDPTCAWIVDYADIKAAFAPLHDALDHRYLNEVEGLENPTSEIIAAWIFERFHLPGVKLVRVEVKETCTSSCVVYAIA